MGEFLSALGRLFVSPTFWTVLTGVIAVAGLILSQLPPIRQMLSGKKLRLVVADRVQFGHSIGVSDANLWVDLENTGGAPISVRALRCYLLRRHGEPVQSLRARTYWLTEGFVQGRPFELPMSEIALRPGGRWSGYLRFQDKAIWTKAFKGKFEALKTSFREDLTAKLYDRDRQLAGEKKPLVEVEPELLLELKQFMDQHRKLETGEYDLLVCAYEDPREGPLCILGFEFTLYEDDIREIFQDEADYKFGFGICFDAQRVGSTWVDLYTKDDPQSRAAYRMLPDASVL